jgi:hypothetical protein
MAARSFEYLYPLEPSMKAIQICVAPESDHIHPLVVALGEDGVVYTMNLSNNPEDRTWHSSPPLPDPSK